MVDLQECCILREEDSHAGPGYIYNNITQIKTT